MPKPIRRQYTIKLEFGSEFQQEACMHILNTILKSFKTTMEEQHKGNGVHFSVQEL